jgi:hypothetical protein
MLVEDKENEDFDVVETEEIEEAKMKSKKYEEEDEESDEEEELEEEEESKDDSDEDEEEDDEEEMEESYDNLYIDAIVESAGESKSGMVQAILESASDIDKEELSLKLPSILEALLCDPKDIEAKKLQESIYVSRQDLNLDEDVKALLAGEQLDESFKEKAELIFQSAVIRETNKRIEILEQNFQEDVQEKIEEYKENLVERLDKFLDSEVNVWMEENKIAIETGIKVQMVENFMTGLTTLFEENYVDIPSDKVDYIAQIEAEKSQLEEELNKSLERNIELNESVQKSRQKEIFIEACEDLTYSQKEKLSELIEGIEFKSTEDFTKSLDVLKESYFGYSEEEFHFEQELSESQELGEDYILDSEEKENTAMDDYVSALSRQLKSKKK